MNPYERVGDDGVQPTMTDVAKEALVLLDEINAEMYKRGMKGYFARIDGIRRGFVKADRVQSERVAVDSLP
jgi:hypothetical protein